MSRGVVGAIIGLVVGWALASMFRGVLSRAGITGLLTLAGIIACGVVGFGLGGIVGAVVGGILGLLLSGMVVGLFFQLVWLAAMVFGAVLGWQLATGKR